MTQTIKTDQYYLLVDTMPNIKKEGGYAYVMRDSYDRMDAALGFETKKGYHWELLKIDFKAADKSLFKGNNVYRVLAHLPIGNAPLLEGVPVLQPYAFKSIPTGEIAYQRINGYYIGNEFLADLETLISEPSTYIPLPPELPKQEEDVMSLAREAAVMNNYDTEDDTFKHGYVVGYRATSQGRMYSEVLKILEDETYGAGSVNRDEYKARVTARIEALQSLSPVEQWEFEPEWEHFDLDMDSGDAIPVTLPDKTQLKIINNIVQGKWIKK